MEKKLIVIRQNDQVITNRDITNLDNAPDIIGELKKLYPEKEFALFLHECNEGQPCKEEPVKYKELDKLAKAAEKEAVTAGDAAAAAGAAADAKTKTAKDKKAAGKK